MLPLDHVTVAGPALPLMQAALADIGIDTVYGGGHRDGATEMALVSFLDGSYLELIARQTGAPPDVVEQHPWARFLTTNSGPCAWALRADDLHAELRRLRSAGVAVAGPAANGRLRPDGVRLDWHIGTCGAGASGAFFPFLIQDLTPREWRAFPHGTPCNRDVRGIARVILAVRNLDAAIARYRQAFGLTAVRKHADLVFGAQLAVPSDAPIVFAQPLAPDSWLTARIEQFGEAPCAIVLDGAPSQRQPAGEQSRWFDLQVRWFDTAKLGWRLGCVTGI